MLDSRAPVRKRERGAALTHRPCLGVRELGTAGGGVETDATRQANCRARGRDRTNRVRRLADAALNRWGHPGPASET